MKMEDNNINTLQEWEEGVSSKSSYLNELGIWNSTQRLVISFPLALLILLYFYAWPLESEAEMPL